MIVKLTTRFTVRGKPFTESWVYPAYTDRNKFEVDHNAIMAINRPNGEALIEFSYAR